MLPVRKIIGGNAIPIIWKEVDREIIYYFAAPDIPDTKGNIFPQDLKSDFLIRRLMCKSPQGYRHQPTNARLFFFFKERDSTAWVCNGMPNIFFPQRKSGETFRKFCIVCFQLRSLSYFYYIFCQIPPRFLFCLHSLAPPSSLLLSICTWSVLKATTPPTNSLEPILRFNYLRRWPQLRLRVGKKRDLLICLKGKERRGNGRLCGGPKYPFFIRDANCSVAGPLVPLVVA